MAVFFCVQKPESIYDDNRGQSYEYFQRLPNGRQIEEGDWLVFTLTGSTSKNGQKVTGLGQIESLDYQEQGRDTLIRANYSRYKQFNPPLTYEQIGGDPRKNVQHAMNRVDEPNGKSWWIGFSSLINSPNRLVPEAAQRLQNSTTPAGAIPVVAKSYCRVTGFFSLKKFGLVDQYVLFVQSRV